MLFEVFGSLKKRAIKGFTYISLMLLIMSAFSVNAFAQKAEKEVYKIRNISESGYSSIDFNSSYEKESSNSVLKKAASLPSKYDLRNENRLTEVKDQGIYGACWAFSSVAVAESSLISKFSNTYNKDNTDLSELHLSYFCFAKASDKLNLTNGDYAKVKNNAFLDMGGNLYFSSFTLAKWFGVTDEKNAPYSSASNTITFPKENAYKNNKAVLENAYWVPMKKTDEVKRLIMEYGACGVSFYHDDLYLNNSTGGYYQRFRSVGNHSATLVGWDDNYSRDNFGGALGLSVKPKKNGAWLIKNSYGTEVGDEGYFWVSYEDRSIYTDDAVFFDFTSTDTYYNNYQYDGTCAFASYCYKNKIYAANVFTCEDTEYLSAISFFNGDTNATYKYQIYINPKKSTNPTSGTAVFDKYQSCNIKYAGYNTVKLKKEIQLKKGDKFAVVILTQKNDGKAYAMCDYSGYIDTNNTIYSYTSSKKGQSLMSSDGKKWEDLYDNGENENFRIKAFTKKGTVKPKKLTADTEKLKLSLSQSKKIKLTPSPAYSSSSALWSSSDESVATVSKSGKIKAVGIGKTVITYTSKSDEKLKGQITVTVVPKKVQDLKQTSSKTNTVTVSWAKDKSATGYAVYKYDNEKKKKVLLGKTQKNKFTLKKLKSASKIKLYVYAYKETEKENSKKTYTSPAVTLTVLTRPKAVKLKKESAENNTLTLKWSKSKGATEYRVYAYNSETEEYTLLGKTKKTTIKLKKLSKNKTYHIVVKARIYNGKSYYASANSNVLKVKM